VCKTDAPAANSSSGGDDDDDDGTSAPALIYFEFRTQLSTAILFYADDRGRADGEETREEDERFGRRQPVQRFRFVLVRLVRGTVQLRYDVSTTADESDERREYDVPVADENVEEHSVSSPSSSTGDWLTDASRLTAVGEGLDDGRWHSVSVRSVEHGRRLLLSVDGISEPPEPFAGSTTVVDGLAFDSPPFAEDHDDDDDEDEDESDLSDASQGDGIAVRLTGGSYIGGLPTATRRRPVQLALPQAAFERHLRGSVRRVCINRLCSGRPAAGRRDDDGELPTTHEPSSFGTHLLATAPCNPAQFIDAVELSGGSRLVTAGDSDAFDAANWNRQERPSYGFRYNVNADREKGGSAKPKEEIDHCAGAKDPCRNGGVCVDPTAASRTDLEVATGFASVAAEEPVCECDRTDFDGPRCDIGECARFVQRIDKSMYVDVLFPAE
jgi:hypothetical protein